MSKALSGNTTQFQGHVRLEGQGPLEGTVVQVAPGSGFFATTDASGFFSFDGVPRGVYPVAFTHLQSGSVVTTVDFRAGGTVSRDLDFPPVQAASLELILVSDVTGLPLQSVEVSLDGIQVFPIDASGRVEIGQLAAGTYPIIIRGQGVPNQVHTTLDIEPGSNLIQLQVEIVPLSLSGEIITQEGISLSGVQVSIAQDDSGSSPALAKSLQNLPPMVQAQSDSTGYYQFSAIPQGNHSVVFVKPGYWAVVQDVSLDSSRLENIQMIPKNGDLNQDGKVDYADILSLAAFWGKTYSFPITTLSEVIKFNIDLNDDGIIDQNDLYRLLLQMGEN